MRSRKGILGLLLIAAAACAGGDDGGMGPGTNLPQGSLSARIDGTNWAASTALIAAWNGNIITISGTDGATQTLGFATVATGPGTFAIGGPAGANALLAIGSTGASWNAAVSRGSGSITISTLSATGATGTFSFVLAPNTGSTTSKTVTEGRFDVKFR